MSETIWDLKAVPWSDAPRYYPPGQHPATAQMRAQLKKAEEFKAEIDRQRALTGAVVDTKQLVEFINYLREQLVNFEQGESDRKARDHGMLSDHG